MAMPDTIGLSVADLLGELKRLKARVAALEGGTSSGSISMATSVVSETSFGQSTQVGTSALAARADHSHGTPARPSLTFSFVATGDGTTIAFTIPAQTGDPIVVVNGVVQRPDTDSEAMDYSISGTTLTFNTAPADGLWIAIWY